MISLIKFYYILTKPKNLKKFDDLIKEIKNLRVPEFPLTGEYLINKGFKSGRKIGEILKKVEKVWIENDFNLKKEDLNNLIKKYN